MYSQPSYNEVFGNRSIRNSDLPYKTDKFVPRSMETVYCVLWISRNKKHGISTNPIIRAMYIETKAIQGKILIELKSLYKKYQEMKQELN